MTTAGTAVNLASNACRKVIIQAHESNTGTIAIGSSTVVAALVGRSGLAIYPTQFATFNVTNTDKLYVDSTANGDKINWYFEV